MAANRGNGKTRKREEADAQERRYIVSKLERSLAKEGKPVLFLATQKSEGNMREREGDTLPKRKREKSKLSREIGGQRMPKQPNYQGMGKGQKLRGGRKGGGNEG